MSERTSIQIYRSTKTELTKIQGELQLRDGIRRSYDEVILELVGFWRESGEKKCAES